MDSVPDARLQALSFRMGSMLQVVSQRLIDRDPEEERGSQGI